MSAFNSTSLICPICSAENTSGAANCFLCGQSLAGTEAVAAKKPGEAVATDAHRPTFHLNSMMLVIAAIAILLGLWHESQGLALVVAVPALIALVRTVVVARDSDSWFNHAAVFAATFMAVVVVVTAGVAAFFATCFAVAAKNSGPRGGGDVETGFWLGIIAGVAAAIGLTIVFVRIGRRRRGT